MVIEINSYQIWLNFGGSFLINDYFRLTFFVYLKNGKREQKVRPFLFVESMTTFLFVLTLTITLFVLLSFFAYALHTISDDDDLDEYEIENDDDSDTSDD